MPIENEHTINKDETLYLLRNIYFMINNISKRIDTIDSELTMIRQEVSKLGNYSEKNKLEPHYR